MLRRGLDAFRFFFKQGARYSITNNSIYFSRIMTAFYSMRPDTRYELEMISSNSVQIVDKISGFLISL